MRFRSFRAILAICPAFVAIIVAPLLVGTASLSAAAMPRALDPPTCFGREVTIVGTTGDDAVLGTMESDVIRALAGHDEVFAVASDADPNLEMGDDYICAGRGWDDVDGGGGDDHIAGGQAPDTLFGHDGDDYIAGGRGSDSLFGLGGNDTILGGYGIDEIESHAGGDVVNGGPRFDELCAGAGRDEIRGGRGADAIGWCGSISTGIDRYFGGPGDDSIRSDDYPEQTSADVVDGGPGTDRCLIDPEDTATNCETVEII